VVKLLDRQDHLLSDPEGLSEYQTQQGKRRNEKNSFDCGRAHIMDQKCKDITLTSATGQFNKTLTE
jgi:hypothetical protein